MYTWIFETEKRRAIMLTLRRDDPVAVVTTIREGDLRSLQRLLEKHPGVASARIQDQKGGLRTLLHVATDWPGHFPNCAAVIRVLIRSGGNPNVQIEGSSHPETPVLSKYSAAGVPVGGRNSVESCRGSRRKESWKMATDLRQPKLDF